MGQTFQFLLSIKIYLNSTKTVSRFKAARIMELSFEQLQFIQQEHELLKDSCTEFYNKNTHESSACLAVARARLSEFVYTIEKLFSVDFDTDILPKIKS